MSRCPSLFTLQGLLKAADGQCQAGLPDGRWVPARPRGFQSRKMRFRCAWLVFTGRADAVTWPGQ